MLKKGCPPQKKTEPQMTLAYKNVGCNLRFLKKMLSVLIFFLH